jgi:hypothetical protein
MFDSSKHITRFDMLKRTLLIKLYLVFSFGLLSIGLHAQDYIDLFKFNYAQAPNSTFDNSSVNTTLVELTGDFTLPIVLNDKYNIITGASYENFSASFDPGRAVESITGITAKLGLNITHNEKWSGTYMALPKIASDLKDISNRDFQYGAIVLLKYTKTATFNYKFGVYANDELFGPLIVPIFGLYYLSPSEKFEAKILAPLAADFNYSFTNNIRVGLNFNGQVRSYNITTPIGTEADRYLEKSSNDLIAYFQYGLNNGINLQVGVGRSIGRSFRLYNEKIAFALPLAKFSDNRTQLNSDFSDSWVFKVGVFYRYDIEGSNN